MGAEESPRDAQKFLGFFAESKLILGYAGTVWQMIPWRQKLTFFVAAVLMAAVSACNIGFPLLLGQLVDLARPEHADEGRATLLRAAASILGSIAALYVLREAVQLVRRYMIEAACTRLEQLMTVRVIGHMMKADLSAFTQDKLGALQGRISRTTVGFVRFVRLALLDFLPPLVTGAFAIIAALAKQPLLAVVMAGVVPISLWLTVRQISSQKGVRLRLIRGRENIDGAVVELLGGIDYVRAANTEDHELKRIGAAARGLRTLEKGHHFQMSLYGCARALNEGFFHILVLGLAVFLAVHGYITYGDILTFSILFLNVMAPLNEVHRGLDEGHECSLQVADLVAMLDQEPDRSFSPKKVEPPQVESDRPLLEANNLVVEYATPAGVRRALDGVSLAIRHGETIGLAGPSGCGKTTLLRVLLRLTHPSAGTVRVGGVPIAHLSRPDIGRLIGYVGQNPFVFSGTVAENIAYGVAGANPEAVEAAARRAYIHDEIMAMPDGYQAQVAERGANLSGGQRQRLALARVFLKDPPVLILDEGTSALDTISERQIKKAIDLARRDRTVILVAHRLSTLKDADRILVFQGGRVVEEGTFLELSLQDGVFAELVRCSELMADETRPLVAAAP
jgi:ATP-binding cassette subfamily B protein